MRLILLLNLFVLMLCITEVRADPDTKDLFDPPASVGMLDLAKVPLFVDVLQSLGLVLRDKTMEEAFTKQFDDLRIMMDMELAGSKMGYLVSVEEYMDEFGTPIVPGGQIVFAIGKGSEPIDALAESIRKPGLRTPKPVTYVSNQSYYIWVKERAGKLTGGMIPRELRGTLESAAKAEADRRDLMGEWVAALPPGGIARIQRADYWSNLASKYALYLDTEARRARITQMTQKFVDAQKSFNEAYGKYQETVAQMAKIQKYNATLENIANVTNLISSAVQAGSLVNSNNQSPAPKTTGEPRADLKTIIEYNDTQYNGHTGEQHNLKMRIEVQVGQLQKLDNDLKTEYRNGNVTIPGADSIFVLPKFP